MISLHASPTVITEATQLLGEFYFVSSAKVFGGIEGQITQQSYEPLEIGKGGWVRGTITSLGPVIISGKFEGTLTSHTRVILKSTAYVKGNIQTPLLSIEPGGYLFGEVSKKIIR